MVCGTSPYQYATASRLKHDLAGYHLEQFNLARKSVPDNAVFFTPDPTIAAPLWAHSDGCALQLVGAFDAFACAIAHKLHRPRSDRASMARLIPRASDGQFSSLVKHVQGATEFTELLELRNHAAHRRVLGQSVHATSEDPGVLRLYLETDAMTSIVRTEANDELARLLAWARGPLVQLWTEAETWRRIGEPTVLGTALAIESR
jgi:hypothetical protein